MTRYCLFILLFFTPLYIASAQYSASAKDSLIPGTVLIEKGPFIRGSDERQREHAYNLDEIAYNHNITRKQAWYSREYPLQQIDIPYDYRIAKTPVTQDQYQVFIDETGYPAPYVDGRTWRDYGLIHPYTRASKFLWIDNSHPAGKDNHPVVMVSWHDANAYTQWLSQKTGDIWRLPTEQEWEKAIRGTDGRLFPWGNKWNANRLNSHDNGPFETMPVGSFPRGVSPFGVLDGAGQVFEWTAAKAGDTNRYVVKGGSWDDKGCGVCRPAARHARPADIKHILIGFRPVKEVQ